MSGDDDSRKGPEQEPSSETDEQNVSGVDESALCDEREQGADVIDIAAKRIDGDDDEVSEVP